MAVARTTHRLYGANRPGLGESRTWIGNRVTDSNGAGIGRLEDVWVDAVSGEPAWLLVREGRFGGGRHRLVPFAGSTGGGGQVWIPFDRDTVRSAPEIGPEELLTADLGDELRRHYGKLGSRRPPRLSGRRSVVRR